MDIRSNQALVRLSDTDLTVLDPAQDVRGRKVLDADGQEIGHVDDLLIDDTEKRVRFLRIASGGVLGIGAHKFLIPVDAVTTVRADTVAIDRTRDHVTAGPPYDPELTPDRDHLEQVYGYYGFMPYWGAGYIQPGFPFHP